MENKFLKRFFYFVSLPLDSRYLLDPQLSPECQSLFCLVHQRVGVVHRFVRESKTKMIKYQDAVVLGQLVNNIIVVIAGGRKSMDQYHSLICISLLQAEHLVSEDLHHLSSGEPLLLSRRQVVQSRRLHSG